MKITLGQYQIDASTTNKIPKGESETTVAILGLTGEIGSLSSVVKKYMRDGSSYKSFKHDAEEEIGDILWYLSNLGGKLGVDFSKLDPLPMITNVTDSEAIESIKRLLSYEIENGILIKAKTGTEISGSNLFQRVLKELNNLSHWIGTSLEEIAYKNLEKVKLMWIPDDSPAPFRDKNFQSYEQLPRRMSITLIQQKKNNTFSVVVRADDRFNIGDRLTDNSYENDGYRFHDIFHWSYAAVLGWSPIIRSILGVKRKSDSKTDEVEDGARAKIIEEAVSIYLFNYSKKHGRFTESSAVERGVIKYIRGLVVGLEVENARDWEWQRAIVKGHDAFHKVRELFEKGNRERVTIQICADSRDIRVID